jgi:predicted dinucleotide-utilizing enzyme
MVGDSSSQRPYLYQVCTPELVAEQIETQLESEDVIVETMSQIEVRQMLLKAALDRYAVVLSTVSIIDDLIIETMDQGEKDGGGVESLGA